MSNQETQGQAGVTESEPKLNHPRYLISYFLIYFCIYFFFWQTPMVKFMQVKCAYGMTALYRCRDFSLSLRPDNPLTAALSTTDLFIVSVVDSALLKGKHVLGIT
jgi:hypothetical protein